ncbi:PREDICTED: putative F-box protein At1g67450 [Camelina sativa]|uniref:F-box protein At1g67450 n=1 Tax=Camelina sativa TaxID=90675 RepID=A0ABM0T0R0_CAMSA|nr:PREDICTED: putative F-box protein At1g67450 [Camelina sativa]
MTLMMSDLPEDLIEDILSRVPITSLGAVRSTCKRWNSLSKDRIVCRGETKHQFLGFMVQKSKVCSLRFDFNGIQNEDVELAGPSIKPIDKFNELRIFEVNNCNGLRLPVRIYHVKHCNGLLLLVTKEINFRLLVWNPYLGQTGLVQPRISFDFQDRYYLGYGNNRTHKILRIFDNYEIYDFKSNLWKVLDITPDVGYRNICGCSLSVKGNTYFIRRETRGDWVRPRDVFLQCFDFTRERNGPRLPMPFQVSIYDAVTLSSIREEQLAVLLKNTYKMEIWVTTKIEPNAVSWSHFLKFIDFKLKISVLSFFIDQEKKLAVIFDLRVSKGSIDKTYIAHIIGEAGYLRTVDLGVVSPQFLPLPVCSYAPSLVQINQSQEISLI